MKPVYEMIGYQLVDIKYKRLQLGVPEYFKLYLKGSQFDEARSIYIIEPLFEIKFKDVELSTLLFSAAFRINDLTWKDKMSKEQVDATFMAAVYPFIRSMIHHVTDDYRGAINLPVIDIRLANLEKGVTFEPHTKTSDPGLKN